MSLAIITGSSGLVGSESVNFFCDKGFDVIGIDNNLRKFFFGKNGSTSWIKSQLIKQDNRLDIELKNVFIKLNIKKRSFSLNTQDIKLFINKLININNNILMK